MPEQFRDIVLGMLEHRVWKMAQTVLTHRTREGRAAALEQIPATMRELVRTEAMRLYARRSSGSRPVPA